MPNAGHAGTPAIMPNAGHAGMQARARGHTGTPARRARRHAGTPARRLSCPMPGTPACRHAGTLACRHAGTPTRRHDGNASPTPLGIRARWHASQCALDRSRARAATRRRRGRGAAVLIRGGRDEWTRARSDRHRHRSEPGGVQGHSHLGLYSDERGVGSSARVVRTIVTARASSARRNPGAEHEERGTDHTPLEWQAGGKEPNGGWASARDEPKEVS